MECYKAIGNNVLDIQDPIWIVLKNMMLHEKNFRKQNETSNTIPVTNSLSVHIQGICTTIGQKIYILHIQVHILKVLDWLSME